MNASISIPARPAGRLSADRFAGFGPLFRKELRERADSKRTWVILAVTTLFMGLTAANGAITTWLVANVPGGEVSTKSISLDPVVNFMGAVSSQIFVVVAIFAAMSLLIGERDRGTLSWVASKPVSRASIWLSKWVAASIIVSLVAGIIPMAATFGLVVVLYGSAGVTTFLAAAVGAAALVTFMMAVVLAVSTIISNQAAVAAIGFMVFFLPQLLAGLLPVDVTPFLATSILGWTIGLGAGMDIGIVTPIVRPSRSSPWSRSPRGGWIAWSSRKSRGASPSRSQRPVESFRPGAFALHRCGIERRHELEVVAVGIFECRDPGGREAFHLEGIRLGHDDRAGGLEAVEVTLDVGRRDVPDQAARCGVPAVDLGMRPDSDEAGADRPAAVGVVGHRGLAEAASCSTRSAPSGCPIR